MFSDTEEQQIRRALGITGNRRKSNEEYLKENAAAYGKFAYDLGIAYFYSYNGTGNKAAARKWLKAAAGAEPSALLNEKNIKRAQNLYKIADYYDSLGVRNQAGDSMGSYSKYWQDLVHMAEEDAKNGSDNVNTLLLYKELTAQIVTNASGFKQAGITERQIKAQLEKAADILQKMEIVKGSANADYEQEMKKELKRNLRIAETIILSTFNTSNINADVQGGGENAADSAEN